MSWHDEKLDFLEGEDGEQQDNPYDEGTLCGVYHGGDDLLDTNKRTVTCRQCIKFIKMIRRVRCSEAPYCKQGNSYE